MIVTSSVPAPMSNVRILASSSNSKPYTKAAAVGSAIVSTSSNPAFLAASLIGSVRVASKYAGTLITAFSIMPPIIGLTLGFSASSFISRRIYSRMWEGAKRSSPTFMRILPPGPLSILYWNRLSSPLSSAVL